MTALGLGILLVSLPGCQKRETETSDEWTPSPMPVAAASVARAAEPSPPSFGEPPQAVDPFGADRSTPTPAPALEPMQTRGAFENPQFSTDPQGKQTAQEFSGTVSEVFLSFEVEAPRKAGTVKSVWTSQVVPEVKSVDSTSLKPGRQRVVFSMQRPGAAWPPGVIQVDLSLADQKPARFAFSINGDNAPPAAQATPAKPSDARIGYAYLNAEEGSDKLVQDFPTTVPQLRLVVDTQKLPAGIPVEAVWKAERVGDIPAGYVFSQDKVRATGTADEDTLFTLPPPPGKPFQAGDYQVEVMVARKTVWSCPFRVREP